jgi:hypothetical protein
MFTRDWVVFRIFLTIAGGILPKKNQRNKYSSKGQDYL